MQGENKDASLGITGNPWAVTAELVNAVLPFIVSTSAAFVLYGKQATAEQVIAEIKQRYGVEPDAYAVAKLLANLTATVQDETGGPVN